MAARVAPDAACFVAKDVAAAASLHVGDWEAIISLKAVPGWQVFVPLGLAVNAEMVLACRTTR